MSNDEQHPAVSYLQELTYEIAQLIEEQCRGRRPESTLRRNAEYRIQKMLKEAPNTVSALLRQRA